jgi:hypothetical protein
MFFIIISAPHFGRFFRHHQELIKLYVQQESMTIPKAPEEDEICGKHKGCRLTTIVMVRKIWR